MIHTNRIVTVGEQECIIDRPIVLYRGDREVEIEFTLVGNEFMFSEEGNVIKSVNASHGQLVLNTPSGEHMFSELAECHEGKVVFVVTKEMIDEFVEVGFYSFQIRLYDSAEMKSRVTIPPVMNGFDIRNPIAAEDETNVVDQGIVDYARIFKDQSNEELPTFDWTGAYNKTEWVHHDVITENKMNKIEDAIYYINANIKESDVVMLNALDNVKKDADKYVKEHMAEVEADVEDFERNLNTDVQQFKIDTNAAMTAHKNEVSEELEGFSTQLADIENDINRRSINVTNLFTEQLNDDNTSIQLYNALKYCADNGYMAFIPGGTYIVSRLANTSIDNAAALVIPKGCDVIFGKGVIFKLKPDSPSWTRTVVLHGDNNLYGHFEIDGSASTITAGNEHMAGLFMYGKSDIYIESVYSHDCYGDNVQISGNAGELGRNVIIDRLRCKNAGRKSLVFEGTTNIHIKNAYLDNGGCLDIEPFGGDVECYYRIDRLEATGSSDFTAGTTKEKGRRYILDVGTWIQRTGTFLSYALCINIDTAVFYDAQINQTYASYLNIRNAFFIYPTKGIIDSRHNNDMPNVNINTAKVFGTGAETFNHLIFCQGGMLSINNLEVYNVNASLLYYQATDSSNVYFGNLYLENSGKSGAALTYLAGHGNCNGNVIFDNVVIADTRETTVTKMLDVVTYNMIDKVKMRNYTFTPNTISPGSSHYGNFTVNVHGNGANTQYRPTNIKIGYQYYDTSLKKPIWWNGSKWTDATGAEV